MGNQVPIKLENFYGRGFKAYCWVDKDGRTCSPYFSTQEKARKWKETYDATH